MKLSRITHYKGRKQTMLARLAYHRDLISGTVGTIAVVLFVLVMVNLIGGLN